MRWEPVAVASVMMQARTYNNNDTGLGVADEALRYQRTFRGHMTALSDRDHLDVFCYGRLTGLTVL